MTVLPFLFSLLSRLISNVAEEPAEENFKWLSGKPKPSSVNSPRFLTLGV